MNRYIAVGLVADMQAGKRVVFVGEDQKVAREAFRQALLAVDDDLLDRAYHTNGDERILLKGGGSARFISSRSNAHRGLSADVVFLHGGGMDASRYLPMLPSEVIRA